MNRRALAYRVTWHGIVRESEIVFATVEDAPEGARALIEYVGGMHGYWYPAKGYGTATETDDSMSIIYEPGRQGETGIDLEPLTVERWNETDGTAKVKSLDELATLLGG